MRNEPPFFVRTRGQPKRIVQEIPARNSREAIQMGAAWLAKLNDGLQYEIIDCEGSITYTLRSVPQAARLAAEHHCSRDNQNRCHTCGKDMSDWC